MYANNYEFSSTSVNPSQPESTYNQQQTSEVSGAEITTNYFPNSYSNYYNYNHYQHGTADIYNQQANYYPYYNQPYYYQQQYMQQIPPKSDTSFPQPAYNFNYTQPQKSTTPPPQYSKSFEVTPEKSVNDSGIDLISPMVQSSKSVQHTSSPIVENPPQDFSSSKSEIDSDDDSEDEENEPVAKSISSDSDDVSKPPKPYLEIIADAILSSKVKMMQLHEIYHYMEKKSQYFAKNINKSWRNSVRHNLSLNECFVKAGRGSNGKGNYWKIHPLCEKEFIRGNFRRKSFKILIRAGVNQNRAATQAPFSDYSLNYQNMPPALPGQLVGQFSQVPLNSQFNYQFSQYQQSDAYPSSTKQTSFKRYSPY